MTHKEIISVKRQINYHKEVQKEDHLKFQIWI